MAIEIKVFERLDVMRLLDRMCLGEQMVVCATCGGMGFGLKRIKSTDPYTTICLGCGEATNLVPSLEIR